MTTEQQSSVERIERLLRKARRRNLIYWLIWMVPAAVVFASILAGLIFGPQPLWVQILDWASWVTFLTWLAAGILLGTGPKSIREFVFGLEPELSEDQKAEKEKRDELRII